MLVSSLQGTKEPHIDDGHSHELQQALALIIVLLSYTYGALGILGHVLCIPSLHSHTMDIRIVIQESKAVRTQHL